MSNESLALEWLRKYLGRTITIDEIGYESNVFDYEELDDMLLPEEDFSIFKSYKQLLTHVYNVILVWKIDKKQYYKKHTIKNQITVTIHKQLR